MPKVVACAGFPVETHTIDPINYDEMRPGCYDPKSRGWPTWTSTGPNAHCVFR